jgi:DNA modification methylase
MTVRIIQGDCRSELKKLADASVHCCVTSPPYWGLRDYGTEPQLWGGDPACDHDWTGFMRAGLSGGLDKSLAYTSNQLIEPQQQQQCKKCAAWMGNFGLEPTPQMYVDHTVEIFREARRVLREDGTLWLNLGDSYGTAGNRNGLDGSTVNGSKAYFRGCDDAKPDREQDTELRPKNLVGIPWRVAFALQADGWYLRQDIIWSKPNPMPESVKDRCTKAHEYLFLLAKSERYYFDAEAIQEPFAETSIARLEQPSIEQQAGSDRVPGKTNGPMKACGPSSYRGSTFTKGKTAEPHANVGQGERVEAAGRNKRSVWTVTTQPFKEAHFATFPPALIEPCILAGCPEGGTVLDPFGGAGTTGLVADRHWRNAILIELNSEYAAMARKRITADGPLFADVA